jgi:hypothetical protein
MGACAAFDCIGTPGLRLLASFRIKLALPLTLYEAP